MYKGDFLSGILIPYMSPNMKSYATERNKIDIIYLMNLSFFHRFYFIFFKISVLESQISGKYSVVSTHNILRG